MKVAQEGSIAARSRLWFLVVALVSLALVVAGCGDDEDSGSNGSGAPSTSTSAASAPDEKVAGKKIGYLDIFAAAPIEKRFYGAFKHGAEAIGWEVEIADVAADQNKTVTAARNFINSGVDAIVGSSIAAEWMRPVKQLAEQKGVLLVNIQTQASPGVYDADITEPQEAMSKALAAQVVKDVPAGAEIGVMYEGLIPGEVERYKIIQEELKAKDIKVVQTADIPVGDGQATQKAATDMLTAHPNIQAIVAASVQFPPFIQAAMRTVNKPDVRIYSWYADSTNSGLMKKGELAAVVDSDIAKQGYIAIDELLKGFSGEAMTEHQFVDVVPVTVAKADITPTMEADEGPVSFEEMGKPFLEQWKQTYGLGQ
jgi:ABC-type sugar transport system substrate-binding protein